MGSEVTVLEALPRILATTDAEVGSVVARSFKKRGVNVQEGVRITGIDGARELTVSWEGASGEKSVEVDKLIVSIGRAPLSAGIGLEAAGVGVDDRGYVVVDERLETSVPGIFAAGDVIDAPQLAHVGFAEGITIVKTLLGEEPHAGRLRQGALGHLLPARVGVVWPHRGAGSRAWSRRGGRQAPFRG